MSTPFKMKGPSLYNSPLTKKTPGGATLVRTGKKKKDSTVKDAIELAKKAAEDDKSANTTVVVPTNRTKVEKPKSEREHYKNIPGFN